MRPRESRYPCESDCVRGFSRSMKTEYSLVASTMVRAIANVMRAVLYTCEMRPLRMGFQNAEGGLVGERIGESSRTARSAMEDG